LNLLSIATLETGDLRQCLRVGQLQLSVESEPYQGNIDPARIVFTLSDFLAPFLGDWRFFTVPKPLFSFALHRLRGQFINALAFIPTLTLSGRARGFPPN
jgi:hypothetical protein